MAFIIMKRIFRFEATVHWKQKLSWAAIKLSVIVANMRCNIEGIKGLTSEASIQSFHYSLESSRRKAIKGVPSIICHHRYQPYLL